MCIRDRSDVDRGRYYCWCASVGDSERRDGRQSTPAVPRRHRHAGLTRRDQTPAHHQVVGDSALLQPPLSIHSFSRYFHSRARLVPHVALSQTMYIINRRNVISPPYRGAQYCNRRVCQSVRLYGYLRFELHQIFYARSQWSWIGSPQAALQYFMHFRFCG